MFIGGTLIGISTVVQSGPGSNYNKEVTSYTPNLHFLSYINKERGERERERDEREREREKERYALLLILVQKSIHDLQRKCKYGCIMHAIPDL